MLQFHPRSSWLEAGVLTFAWAAARANLTDLGYEVSVFHATGA